MTKTKTPKQAVWYRCHNCGNRCLNLTDPEACSCGVPTWHKMRLQKGVKVGEADWLLDEGKPDPTSYPMRTAEHLLVDRGNKLAREFYQSMGYEVPEGYRFDQARHSQERGCWTFAVIAFEFIEGTDLEECLHLAEEADAEIGNAPGDN